MPIYHYKALDSEGKKIKGFVEASTEQNAKQKLREQEIILTAISTKSSMTSRQNLSTTNILTFTDMLSQLISSGVPLYESLMTIEEQYRTEKYHRVIVSLCEQVKAGTSLSEAMATFPESFSKLYYAMIGAGEASGSLDKVLVRLAFLLKRQVKLKKQVFNAMIYPCILATFAIAIIFLLLGYVVPSIEAIFANRQLNGYTQFILSLSHLFRAYWWIGLPATIGLIVWGIYQFKTPKGKLWIESMLMKTPLIRTLLTQTAFARFSRTMSTLLEGGLPMIDALQLSRQVMQNSTLEKDIEIAENHIIEGSSLSKELLNSRWIPHMVSRMLSVGEETGNISVMLSKIADMYEENVEKTIDQVMALAQPVILIVMGIIVGLVLIAVLIPMTDISSLAIGT